MRALHIHPEALHFRMTNDFATRTWTFLFRDFNYSFNWILYKIPQWKDIHTAISPKTNTLQLDMLHQRVIVLIPNTGFLSYLKYLRRNLNRHACWERYVISEKEEEDYCKAGLIIHYRLYIIVFENIVAEWS